MFIQIKKQKFLEALTAFSPANYFGLPGIHDYFDRNLSTGLKKELKLEHD